MKNSNHSNQSHQDQSNFEHLFFEESIRIFNFSLSYFSNRLSSYAVDEALESMAELIALKERIEHLERKLSKRNPSSFAD
jgi:hypothetical protein